MSKKKIIIITFAIIILLLLCFVGYFIYIMDAIFKIPINQTKDYNSIYVNNAIILSDYRIFEDIPDEYNALNQIDYQERQKISEYMKNNNLILCDGEQEFKRNNGKFEELINSFKFQSIDDWNHTGGSAYESR